MVFKIGNQDIEVTEAEAAEILQERTAFLIYNDKARALLDLSNEQLGEFMRGIIENRLNGVIPNYADFALKFAYNLVKSSFEIDDYNYIKTVLRNRENSKKRWAKRETGADDQGDG